MSRIDDLIRDLCPDGVEFHPIGEFAELVRGHGMPKSTFQDSGVNCIHYGHIYTRYGVSTSHAVTCVDRDYATTLTTVNPGDLVVANTSENLEDVGTAVAWLGKENAVTGGHATVIRSNQNSKYLSHYFRTPSFFNDKRRHVFGTKVIELSAKNLARIPVPLPPLEVQNEIARILDKFTELEAELEARQHQFTYYRDHIVTGSQQVQLVPIKDIGELQRERRFTRNDMVDEGIPAIHYGEIYTTYGHKTDSTTSFVKDEIESQLRFAQPGDVIIAAVGETVADVGTGVAWLGTVPVAYHDDSFALHHNQDPRYISHALRAREYHRQKDKFVSRAKVKRLSSRGIEQIRIPLPALAEQRRIADILDDFDALVNDLTSGLPAEIEARRKQYEYYRDRLLTFLEKK